MCQGELVFHFKMLPPNEYDVVILSDLALHFPSGQTLLASFHVIPDHWCIFFDEMSV